jgi:hypothetical protein
VVIKDELYCTWYRIKVLTSGSALKAEEASYSIYAYETRRPLQGKSYALECLEDSAYPTLTVDEEASFVAKFKAAAEALLVFRGQCSPFTYSPFLLLHLLVWS